jgi:type II restriction enzyme
LCAAIELKSQTTAFGKNINNRAEEALGNAVDIWMAANKTLLGPKIPWLGYFLLLTDSAVSTKDRALPKNPLLQLDKAFASTSYQKRFELLCERMVLERVYNGATMLLAERDGTTARPANDNLDFHRFLKALWGHLLGI